MSDSPETPSTPDITPVTPDPDKESSLTRLWSRFRTAVKRSRVFHPDEWPVRKMVGRGLILVVVVFGMAVLRHSVTRVRENQVGIRIDNLRGRMVLEERVGFHFLIPYVTSFHVLDRTLQKLELNWADRSGSGRDVKLKTTDGSNVSLDVSVTFKIKPSEAVNILRRSGKGMQFAGTWMEPFVRQACLSSFGELTTEEMYDASRRDEKARAALKKLNEALGPQGLEVVALIPGEFRFYREYEQVIQEKKLADQQVEEQQAQARALLEDQQRQLVEARKKAETRIAQSEGQFVSQLIQAQTTAETTRKEADISHAGVILNADAGLYRDTQQATGRKATLFAEADALQARRTAMAGLGGLGMVGMEYAKRLSRVRFSGTPITREPSVRQFVVESTGEGPPASVHSATPALEATNPVTPTPTGATAPQTTPAPRAARNPSAVPPRPQ